MASVVEVIWVKSEGAIFLQGGLDSESVICPTGEFAKRRADHQRRRHGRAMSRPSTSFLGVAQSRCGCPHKAGHGDKFHVRHSGARSCASCDAQLRIRKSRTSLFKFSDILIGTQGIRSRSQLKLR
jgi:hypothetical protein